MPLLLTESAGNLVIGRELSIGDVATSTLCLDDEQCDIRTELKKSWTLTGENKDSIRSFIYEYDSPGDYDRTLDLVDQYGNEAKKTGTISLSAT